MAQLKKAGSSKAAAIVAASSTTAVTQVQVVSSSDEQIDKSIVGASSASSAIATTPAENRTTAGNHSGLLRLSTELRFIILRYILPRRIKPPPATGTRTKRRSISYDSVWEAGDVSTSRVNKQLHLESITVLYCEQIFSVLLQSRRAYFLFPVADRTKQPNFGLVTYSDSLDIDSHPGLRLVRRWELYPGYHSFGRSEKQSRVRVDGALAFFEYWRSTSGKRARISIKDCLPIGQEDVFISIGVCFFEYSNSLKDRSSTAECKRSILEAFGIDCSFSDDPPIHELYKKFVAKQMALMGTRYQHGSRLRFATAYKKVHGMDMPVD